MRNVDFQMGDSGLISNNNKRLGRRIMTEIIVLKYIDK